MRRTTRKNAAKHIITVKEQSSRLPGHHCQPFSDTSLTEPFLRSILTVVRRVATLCNSESDSSRSRLIASYPEFVHAIVLDLHQGTRQNYKRIKFARMARDVEFLDVVDGSSVFSSLVWSGIPGH